MTQPDSPAGWRLHDAIKTALHTSRATRGKAGSLIKATDTVYTSVAAFLAELSSEPNRDPMGQAMPGHGPTPPRPSVVDLRATIDSVIEQLATTCAETGSIPDLNGALNRIMNAIGDYTDAIIDRGKEHVCLADIHAGPALVYIHTDGKTVTDVDRVAINGDPEPIGYARERAISRALITEALRLLDTTEA